MSVPSSLEGSEEGDSLGRAGWLLSTDCGAALTSELAGEEVIEWLLGRAGGGGLGERVSPVEVSRAEGGELGRFP